MANTLKVGDRVVIIQDKIHPSFIGRTAIITRCVGDDRFDIGVEVEFTEADTIRQHYNRLRNYGYWELELIGYPLVEWLSK